jgi:hypothetical protein
VIRLSTAVHKWGFVNTKGEVTIPLQFGGAYSFHDGLAATCVGRCTEGSDNNYEGKWGFIDKSGKFVINPQFDDVDNFDNRLGRVSVGRGKERKQGYVDHTGKLIWSPSN